MSKCLKYYEIYDINIINSIGEKRQIIRDNGGIWYEKNYEGNKTI